MQPIELESGLTKACWAIRLCLCLSLLSLYAAVSEWRSPSLPPFHGRRAWVAELLFEIAGPYGQFLLFLAIAIAFAATAGLIWRHAPRVPGDRWF
jgi:hypothetical protein